MLRDDPLWYKDAIIYELHVRAFHDSVGDGVGDFRGLAQKLDYLQDLGVTAIWLLPFYPSPLKDDGYDIAEYTSINSAYGTLADFQELLSAAHERGIRVITELVLNHTSDQHPWFQRARLAPPGSPERDFYVWSDTDRKYAGTRIIFTDTETSHWTGDPRVPEEAAGPRRREISRAHATGRGQPVAGGLDRLLRRSGDRRRRVPHVVPLPGDAAPVHGAAHGGPLSDHRHPSADAADPGEGAVGDLPAQPRRADAGDGDRRGAGLHVPGLRRGPRTANQRRHPETAGAVAGERPAADRA